jgi:hypothetical protein
VWLKNSVFYIAPYTAMLSLGFLSPVKERKEESEVSVYLQKIYYMPWLPVITA